MNQRGTIVGALQIARYRVEIPERCVGGVIESLIASIREHVRNQTVMDVVRERTKNERRLALPSRGERQSLETDHRIAAPVGEPVIAGDDRSNFITEGRGSC